MAVPAQYYKITKIGEFIKLWTGDLIDPKIIKFIGAVDKGARPYIDKGGRECFAYVLIETGSDYYHRLPCRDMHGARKLRDTLVYLVVEALNGARVPASGEGERRRERPPSRYHSSGEQASTRLGDLMPTVGRGRDGRFTSLRRTNGMNA
jgi:hypothetical protein